MEDNSKYIVLSLFDYSGNWSRPWKDAGYDVRQIDIKHGDDVLTYEPPTENVYCVLAAPPCTAFTVAGSRWWKKKDGNGETKAGLALAKRSVEIIEMCKPRVHAIENPVGRLGTLLLGKANFIFHPHWYAGYSPEPEKDRYTKKTCLWGEFKMPERRDMEPIIYELTSKSGKTYRGSYYWAKLGGKSEKTKTLRSNTPQGFAQAFYEANKRV